MPANVGGITIPIGVDAKDIPKAITLVGDLLKEIAKFGFLSKHITAVTDALKVLSTQGAGPTNRALDALASAINKNKLVVKGATPAFDTFNKKLAETQMAASRAAAAIRANQSASMAFIDVAGPKQGAAGQGGGGFFDPAFFAQRARWFVQLRTMWAAYQGVSQAVNDVLALNEALINLEAITGATKSEMALMSDAIRDAAVSTKFYAKDVAEAATRLGQAGFTASQVVEFMKPLSILATAVGSDLESSSKVLTTIFKVWQLDAKYAADVVNALAAGVNKSTLEIQDFNTAFSYSATIMKDMGESVESAIAWTGVLRNLGLQASQIGAGLRNIYHTLSRQTPTAKVEKLISGLGLQWKDISLRYHSLSEILDTFNSKHVTAIDIMGAFEKRTADVLTRMIQYNSQTKEVTKSITDTNYAWKMAEKQMTSFNNLMKKTWSVIGEGTASIMGKGAGLTWIGNFILNLVKGITTVLVASAKLIETTILLPLGAISITIVDFFTTLANLAVNLVQNIMEKGFVGGFKQYIIDSKGIWEDFALRISVTNKQLAYGATQAWKEFKETFKRIWEESKPPTPIPGETGAGAHPGAHPIPFSDKELDRMKAKAAFEIDLSKKMEKFRKREEKIIKSLNLADETKNKILKERMILTDETGARQLEKGGLEVENANIHRNINLLKNDIILRGYLGEIYDEEEAKLEALAAQYDLNVVKIQKLNYYLDRTPWEGFHLGLQKVFVDINDLADRFEDAGVSIANTIKDSMVDSLDMLGDELINQETDWREWGSGVLKSIRRVINELLVFMALKAALGGTSVGNFLGITAFGAARGGILPGGIQAFGRGGIVNSPTLAMLAENKSSELVIPGDKIHKGSAEGYMRDKGAGGDIAIMNVLNPDLMLSAMGSMAGKQVVVNHINSDIWRRGNSYQVIKGVR